MQIRGIVYSILCWEGGGEEEEEEEEEEERRWVNSNSAWLQSKRYKTKLEK